MSFIELETALLHRRAAILRRCLNGIFETYPPETARFMSNEDDRFLNPVGCTIAREMVTPWVTDQGASVLLPNWDQINPLVDEMFR